MKRKSLILLGLLALPVVGYFTATKWAIRHETLALYDPARDNRPVAVELTVRRDKELRAIAGMTTLPVVVLSNGNTVKFTEYSFLANLFAARGYLAISIQQDTDADGPLATKAGEPYAGRLATYERGVANILFAIDRLKLRGVDADYRHLTLVGHSNGGDISMYFAKVHPELVRRVVTLDSLRVPFMTDRKFRILAIRANDPDFKADPGVVPDPYICKMFGIRVLQTEYRHTDMSDRGPDRAKTTVVAMLDQFLADEGALTSIPEMMEPDPIPQMIEPDPMTENLERP